MTSTKRDFRSIWVAPEANLIIVHLLSTVAGHSRREVSVGGLKNNDLLWYLLVDTVTGEYGRRTVPAYKYSQKTALKDSKNEVPTALC